MKQIQGQATEIMLKVLFIPKNKRLCEDLTAVFGYLMGEYREDGTGFFSACMTVKQNSVCSSWNVRNFCQKKKSTESNQMMKQISHCGWNLHP